MIRLLIITDTNIGGDGGAEQHLKMLVGQMDSSQYKIDILQLGEVVPFKQGNLGEVRVWHMPTGKLLSPHGIGQMLKLFKFIRSNRHECIISFFESSDILAALMSRVTGVQCILSSRRDTGFRYSAKLRLAYRYIDRCFDQIIAPSRAVYDSLINQGTSAEKIVLVYNGVDVARFSSSDGQRLREQLAISKDHLLLGIVARLSGEKDHLTLLQAVYQLGQSGRKVALAVVGQGELKNRLIEEVSRLGLESCVHFLGVRDDIPQILAAIDIFVLSSVTEGMSNALLEAMASAKPVVATNVGGNPELVEEGETGYLIPAGNSAAMADAIGRLADNPAMRQRMGAAGRQRVKQLYSIEAMVKKYQSAIQRGMDLHG
ncbi:MAG TPA: glycosyltransferase [Gammaproteobacteria bacterium]|nr:glycosyltransferase [Gammaproteobacteria bacterium]